MPGLPRWIPRNPGCGCLLLLLALAAFLLIRFDGNAP
jgi:hypothetical protein